MKDGTCRRRSCEDVSQGHHLVVSVTHIPQTSVSNQLLLNIVRGKRGLMKVKFKVEVEEAKGKQETGG